MDPSANGVTNNDPTKIFERFVEPLSKKGQNTDAQGSTYPSVSSDSPPHEPGQPSKSETPIPVTSKDQKSSITELQKKSEGTPLGETTKTIGAGNMALRGLAGLVGGVLFAGAAYTGIAMFLTLAAVAVPVGLAAAVIAIPGSALGIGLGALGSKLIMGRVYNANLKQGASVGAAIPLAPVVVAALLVESIATVPKYMMVESVGRMAACCLAFAETGITEEQAHKQHQEQRVNTEFVDAGHGVKFEKITASKDRGKDFESIRTKYLDLLTIVCTPLLFALKKHYG